MTFRSRINGFSLLELLLGIAIIGVLVLLATAGLQTLRGRSVGVRCMGNLRQIGAATAAHAAEHQGDFPFYYYLAGPNQAGSGAATGTWFYNIAPYLNIPRFEPANPGAAHEEKTRLGTPSHRIAAPTVLTCPGHKPTESNDFWQPQPMTFPAMAPVSYAPALTLGTVMTSINRGRLHPTGYTVFSIRLSDVSAPGQKIWLSDSPMPHFLNVSNSRWLPPDQYAANYPHQGFTRHQEAGNALFFDGHVERMPLTRFTKHRLGIDRAIARYFHPLRAPELDD